MAKEVHGAAGEKVEAVTDVIGEARGTVTEAEKDMKKRVERIEEATE